MSNNYSYIQLYERIMNKFDLNVSVYIYMDGNEESSSGF